MIKKIFIKKNYKVLTFICFIAVALIATSLLTFSWVNLSCTPVYKTDYEVIISISAGVLTSILAAFSWYLVQKHIFTEDSDYIRQLDGDIRDLYKFLHYSREKGLLSISSKSDYDPSFWISILEDCNNGITIAGHALNHWFEESYQEAFICRIKTLVKNDKQVNLFFVDPSTESSCRKELRDIFEKNRNCTIENIETIEKYIGKEIENVQKKNVSIYLVPYCFLHSMIIITDHRIYASPYNRFKSNDSNLLFCIDRESVVGRTFTPEILKMTNHNCCYTHTLDKNINFLTDRLNKRKSEILLTNTINSTTSFISQNWNKEICNKYIFEIENKKTEASFFIHYKNDNFIKYAIELPSAFGCKIGCKFCASGSLSLKNPLSKNMILGIYERIIRENKLNKNDIILVTFTGIGELMNNFQSILNTAKEIYSTNPNTKFTFSTIGNDLMVFDYMKQKATEIPIHFLQVTFFSCDMNKVKKIVPNSILNLEQLITKIQENILFTVRINYLMISDFNDSSGDWSDFIKAFGAVKDKIKIRITTINSTNYSEKNKILPVELKKLEEFNIALAQAGYSSYVYFGKAELPINCGQLISELDQ